MFSIISLILISILILFWSKNILHYSILLNLLNLDPWLILSYFCDCPRLMDIILQFLLVLDVSWASVAACVYQVSHIGSYRFLSAWSGNYWGRQEADPSSCYGFVSLFLSLHVLKLCWAHTHWGLLSSHEERDHLIIMKYFLCVWDFISLKTYFAWCYYSYSCSCDSMTRVCMV